FRTKSKPGANTGLRNELKLGFSIPESEDITAFVLYLKRWPGRNALSVYLEP
ncbi:unnamed protein product, partial [marine sediment metagenome]